MSKYLPEIPPHPDKVEYQNPSNKEITADDNDVWLARQVAISFIEARNNVNETQEAIGDTMHRLAEIAVKLKEEMLVSEATKIKEKRKQLRENLNSWRELHTKASNDLEICRKNLEPFWRDGTLDKAGFENLDPEILNFGDVEPLSSLVSRVTYNLDVWEAHKQRNIARHYAEILRDELCKGGDPKKRLPWENTKQL